jgi:DNA-binding transcriptional LysR family regulator
MMVKKLEQELGVKVFDRSRLPLKPVPTGDVILANPARSCMRSGHEVIHS